MSNTKAKRARFAHIQRLQRFDKKLRRDRRRPIELRGPECKDARLVALALGIGGAE